MPGGIIPGLCAVGIIPDDFSDGGFDFASFFSSPSLDGVSAAVPSVTVFVFAAAAGSFFVSPFSFFSEFPAENDPFVVSGVSGGGGPVGAPAPCGGYPGYPGGGGPPW